LAGGHQPKETDQALGGGYGWLSPRTRRLSAAGPEDDNDPGAIAAAWVSVERILVLRDREQREIASRMLREGEDPLVAGRVLLRAHSAKKSNFNARINYPPSRRY
jgi:hypothetical protein